MDLFSSLDESLLIRQSRAARKVVRSSRTEMVRCVVIIDPPVYRYQGNLFSLLISRLKFHVLLGLRPPAIHSIRFPWNLTVRNLKKSLDLPRTFSSDPLRRELDAFFYRSRGHLFARFEGIWSFFPPRPRSPVNVHKSLSARLERKFLF